MGAGFSEPIGIWPAARCPPHRPRYADNSRCSTRPPLSDHPFMAYPYTDHLDDFAKRVPIRSRTRVKTHLLLKSIRSSSTSTTVTARIDRNDERAICSCFPCERGKPQRTDLDQIWTSGKIWSRKICAIYAGHGKQRITPYPPPFHM